MKRKFISVLIAVIMLVSVFGITPALAAGYAVVAYFGPMAVSPGQTYTFAYTLKVTNACAANANISVGGAFEKVSGGENLFYDTIPVNKTGEVIGYVTIRVKPDAAPGSVGTISVLEDESKCSELVFDDSGNIVGEPVITTVTGSLSMRVGPPAPSAPTVSFVAGDKLRVQWNAVSGATGYTISRATSPNGPYSWIHSTSATSYTVSGLTPNTTYYFKIQAFYETEPNNPAFGDPSPYGSGITQPGAPPAPTVSYVSNTSLRVKWNAVEGATGYIIERATSPGGPYSWIHSTGATSYVATGLTPDTTYYFKIRAFYEPKPNSPTFGDPSPYGTGSTKLVVGTPSAPKVTPVSNSSMKLEWSAASNATGYTVWRATSPNGPYSWIHSTVETSFTATGLEPNTTYYFKIQAFYETQPNTPTFGDPSPYSTGRIDLIPGKPNAPNVTPVSNSSMKLEWNAVSNATGYTVWRATSPNGPYSWIHSTSATSYTVTGLEPNTTYYFKIQAFHETRPNNPTFGEASPYSSGRIDIIPGKPNAPTVTPGAASSLKLEWNAVSNAVGYTVWRATSPGGPYSWIHSTVATSYTVTGLAPNTTYYFKIRAFHETRPNNPTYGEYSEYGFGTTHPKPGTPSAPKVTPVSNSSMKLEWSAASNATGYTVSRATSPNGPYSWIHSTSATSYTVTGLEPNTTYYFKIQAFYETQPNSPTFGDPSPYGSGRIDLIPGTPSAPTVTPGAASSLLLQWNTVPNAVGYTIWRATSPSGPYSWVASTGGTSRTITGLEPNTTYYFMIRAFHETRPNSPTFGEYSPYGSGTTHPKPGTPSAPKVTPVSSSSMKLEWSAATNATGYTVSRATSPNGPYSWIHSTSATSYTVTGLEPNTTYYFKIQAFYETQPNSPTFGDPSPYGSGRIDLIPGKPGAPTVTYVSSTSLRVQWNAVSNAVGYTIWRAASPDGPYSWIHSTSETSYVVTGLEPNMTYYFKIRAFHETRPNSPTFGEYSEYGSGTTRE